MEETPAYPRSLPPLIGNGRHDVPTPLECGIVNGRVSNSKGEPPPPYSNSAKRFHTDLPFSEPPKYEERQFSPLRADVVVDKPLDINLKYITSKQACFKFAELIVCIVGLFSCAFFKRSESGRNADLTTFYLFLVISCTLFILAVVWLNLISCFVHFPSKANHMRIAILHIVAGILLLSGSVSIIALVSKNICGVSSELEKQCILLWISFASGFLATLIFWLDAAIQCSTLISD